MRTHEDIEEYLIDFGAPFEALSDGLWVIHDEEDYVENIMVYFAPPIITFRVKLMDLPEKTDKLFEKMLRLNATEMVAGAYGLEDKSVVLVDTLQSENLDYNEFAASVESLTLAISQHYPVLGEFRTSKNTTAAAE